MKTPVLSIYKGTPPHWRMDGYTYFVTWRLAVSPVSLGSEEKTLVADAIKHFSVRRRPELQEYKWVDCSSSL